MSSAAPRSLLGSNFRRIDFLSSGNNVSVKRTITGLAGGRVACRHAGPLARQRHWSAAGLFGRRMEAVDCSSCSPCSTTRQFPRNKFTCLSAVSVTGCRCQSVSAQKHVTPCLCRFELQCNSVFLQTSCTNLQSSRLVHGNCSRSFQIFASHNLRQL